MTHRVFPLREALKRIKSAGFDKVELCSAEAWVPHFDIPNASENSVAECASLFRENGMTAAAINIGGQFPIEKMKYVCELATRIGAPTITIGCGSPVEGQERSELLKKHTEYNASFADLCEEFGLTASVEAPHKKSLAEKSDEIIEYWSLQDERLKCTFDTAHLTYAGEDMLAMARRFAKRVAHIHLRDAVTGNSLLRYGEGTVDFASFIGIFKETGYAGYYSMEYPVDSEEEAAERLESSVAFLKKFNI